jgi:signal transduction histidine kinase/FixJ family two-component response regulator
VAFCKTEISIKGRVLRNTLECPDANDTEGTPPTCHRDDAPNRHTPIGNRGGMRSFNESIGKLLQTSKMTKLAKITLRVFGSSTPITESLDECLVVVYILSFLTLIVLHAVLMFFLVLWWSVHHDLTYTDGVILLCASQLLDFGAFGLLILTVRVPLGSLRRIVKAPLFDPVYLQAIVLISIAPLSLRLIFVSVHLLFSLRGFGVDVPAEAAYVVFELLRITTLCNIFASQLTVLYLIGLSFTWFISLLYVYGLVSGSILIGIFGCLLLVFCFQSLLSMLCGVITHFISYQSNVRQSVIDVVLDGLREAVVVYDGSGRILYSNPSFRKLCPMIESLEDVRIVEIITLIFGYKAHLSDLFDEDGHCLYADINDLWVTEEGVSFDVHSSKYLHGTTRVQSLFFVEQKVSTVFESIMLEQEEKASAKRVGGLFLAAMSHEIRTPLSGVIGLVTLMKEEENLSPEVVEQLEMVESSMENLLVIVNDVVDFSSLEEMKMKLVLKQIDLSTIVSNTVRVMTALVSQKDVQIVTEVHVPSSLCLIGDGQRYQQVLTNLLSNAIKFTPAGTIHVKVELIRQDESEVEVRTSVRDHGCGIPKHLQDRLFNKFEQLSDGRAVGGAGLGLAISKGIVSLMHGTIGVNSERGEGAEFFFNIILAVGKDMAEESKLIAKTDILLPQLQQENNNQCDSLVEPGHTSIGEDEVSDSSIVKPSEVVMEEKSPAPSILVADDSPVNLKVIRKMLKAVTTSISEAENGLIALEMCEKTAFDCILMDCHMPVMDGYACTESIRNSNSPNRNTPIIGFTADVVTSLPKCRAAGMDEYVTKPAKRDVICSLVNAVIQPGYESTLQKGARRNNDASSVIGKARE